ncbi:MAG: hypothetical protein KatS3mg026_1051 [Bacteroidia bacterium]|nr:MAG: hypothetical protein KatS3mg026_1051 [Bacteroidia bacterium]
MRKYWLGFFGSLLVGGCTKAPSEPLVARYRDKYLTRSEALRRLAVPPGADTLLLLRSYAVEWIKQQALADTAYHLLPDLRLQLENQVEEYRTRLLIAYLSRLLTQRLQARFVPSDSALLRQYQTQPEAFRALQAYYQYRWVKLPDSWLARREVVQHLYEPDSLWLKWIQEKGYVGGVSGSWVPRAGLDSLQAFFPTSLASLPVRGHTQASRIEGERAYLLIFQLTGLILPGQVLPFELVKQQIRDLLLQKHLHEALSAFEDTVYRRALARPDVALY